MVGFSRPKPSREAAGLADTMLSDTETMRTILDETIPAQNSRGERVHESGRTVCGSGDTAKVRGPLARFPTSVELAECPRGVRGGTWHTHVTKSELREPNNSLPDTANVIFGHIDVSIVAGTRNAEAVIAAEDPERAKDAFRNAVGADVESTEDVVDAIISGRISDPKAARGRVRSKLSGLFERRRTGFGDLDGRLGRTSIPAQSPTSMEMHEAKFYSAFYGNEDSGNSDDGGQETVAPKVDARQVKYKVKSRKDAAKRKVPMADTVKGAAVSELVSRAISSVL